MKNKGNERPPNWAMAFFHWFCRPDFREEIEGDLMERFHNRSKQSHSKRNKWLFIRDVVFLLRPKIIGISSHWAHTQLLPTKTIAKNISLILVLLLPVWIASFFLSSFINSKGCNQFVIDSYEIRSGIDIPKVDFFSCYYNEEKDVRLSVWKLKGDVDGYLRKHHSHSHAFTPIGIDDLRFDLPLAQSEKPASKQLYISKGSRWGNTWQYVVEKESGKLWIEMKYTPTLLTYILEILSTVILFSIPFLLVLLLFCLLKMLYLNFRKPKVVAG